MCLSAAGVPHDNPQALHESHQRLQLQQAEKHEQGKQGLSPKLIFNYL